MFPKVQRPYAACAQRLGDALLGLLLALALELRVRAADADRHLVFLRVVFDRVEDQARL